MLRRKNVSMALNERVVVLNSIKMYLIIACKCWSMLTWNRRFNSCFCRSDTTPKNRKPFIIKKMQYIFKNILSSICLDKLTTEKVARVIAKMSLYLCPTRHTQAKPSCIIKAATSALAAGSTRCNTSVMNKKFSNKELFMRYR